MCFLFFVATLVGRKTREAPVGGPGDPAPPNNTSSGGAPKETKVEPDGHLNVAPVIKSNTVTKIPVVDEDNGIQVCVCVCVCVCV